VAVAMISPRDDDVMVVVAVDDSGVTDTTVTFVAVDGVFLRGARLRFGMVPSGSGFGFHGFRRLLSILTSCHLKL